MSEPQKQPEQQVFKARNRVLFDLLLVANFILLIPFLAGGLTWAVYLLSAVSFTIVFLLIWFAVIRPLVLIEMTSQSITGRGPNFKKITLLIRKVDIRRTNTPSKGWKRRFLYKDIWSVEKDGCIRLYRRVIGERQLARIMTVIERYPFRETAKPTPSQEIS